MKPRPTPINDNEDDRLACAIARIPILRAAGFAGHGLAPFDFLLLDGAVRNDELVSRRVAAIIASGKAPTVPYSDMAVAALGLPELVDTAAVAIRVLNEMTEPEREAVRERALKKVGRR